MSAEGIQITTLVENSVRRRGLRAEHGLAFLLRAAGASVLFDTGQSDLVVENAGRLGVSLSDLHAVVLSHGHYDHTGGLARVIRGAGRARVYLHPAAVEPKFSVQGDGTTRDVGMPHEGIEVVRAAGGHPDVVVWTQAPRRVVPGVWVTGEIPRQTDYEDVGGRFTRDHAGRCPDPLLDDQALYVETGRGVVVVLGCAHAGVVNTLHHIEQLTGGKPFHAVLGGLHLLHASANRMERTIEALRRWGLGILSPAHCTGVIACARLLAAFPQAYRPCSVGATFEFVT